jgi:nucleoside-diphosphate-sugar epimerase
MPIIRFAWNGAVLSGGTGQDSAFEVLVTGGAGFVGRHFCKRFCSLGYVVTCLDNLVSESALRIDEWPEHLKCGQSSGFRFIEADCRDYFRKQWKDQKYNLVVHLAAVVGGRANIEDAPLAVAEDLSIDAELFTWAVKAQPRKIIFFSSSAAYPVSYQSPTVQTKLAEDMIAFDGTIGMPDLTYGWAKLTGEYLARLAHEKHGLDVVCYRPMSGYGEDQDPCYPFPRIIRRVLARENPVEIWSNAVRDFVHIEDCVDCVLATMDKISDGTALNIGTGSGTNFEELVRKMCRELGHENAKIKILDDKPKGVHYRVGDMTKCKSYGYESTTSLEEGIRRTAEYLETTYSIGGSNVS